LDWARLPWIEAAPERLLVEQPLFTWYTWFLSQGTPTMIRAACNVIARLEKKQQDLERKRGWKEQSGGRSRKKIAEFVRHLYQEPASWRSTSLETLVAALVKYNVSLQEIAVLAQPTAISSDERANQ
jgi:hypothetical protein